MQIHLIGGFAGIDKKKFIFSLDNELTTRGHKIGVIVIEETETNIKNLNFKDSSIIIKEMMNIPCTFTTELLDYLQETNNISTFDHILIELPFSLQPGKVRKELLNLKLKDITFGPIIFVFDIDILKKGVHMLPRIVSRQIKDTEIVYADVYPIDKKKVLGLRSIIKETNPDAHIFEHSSGLEGHRFSDFVNMLTNYTF